MNIRLKYKDAVLAHPDALLAPGRYPGWQFRSPKRSTVPLIAYWRDPARQAQFFQLLELPAPSESILTYEYEVDPLNGRGYPSCTDLMIEANHLVIAVEAKYTEPSGESVKTWLRDPPEKNRKEVLEGWLELIGETTARQLTPEDVMTIPYQTIHRLASACYPMRGQKNIRRILVYQWFTDSEHPDSAKYSTPLTAIKSLISENSIRLVLMTCKIILDRSPLYKPLVHQWDVSRNKKSLDFTELVVSGLNNNDFISFAQPLIWSPGNYRGQTKG